MRPKITICIIALILLLGSNSSGLNSNSLIFVSFRITSGSVGTGPNNFNSPHGMTSNATHYLTVDSSNQRVQITDPDGRFVGSFFTADSPYGITMNDSHIFVTSILDTHSNVRVFDLAGNFAYSFGSNGTADDQFYIPRSIAVNSTHILVTDEGNHRVKIFDHTGTYVSDLIPSDTGSWNYPSSIFMNGSHIFVYDLSGSVRIYDPVGNYISSFGRANIGGIHVTNNYIFLSSYGVSKIQVFDHQLNLLSEFGETGTGELNFDYPWGLATIGNDLAIAEAQNHRIQIVRIQVPPTMTVTETETETETADTTITNTIDQTNLITSQVDITQTHYITETKSEATLGFVILPITLLSTIIFLKRRQS